MKRTKCVDDDPYVSDMGCGIYNDEKGQQFLREQRYRNVNHVVHDTQPMGTYSPDYESEFCVTPPIIDESE